MTQGQFKKDWAALVQKRIDGVSKKDAVALLDDLVTYIAKNAKKDKVYVPGLGIFTVKERAARWGRNPQTGEKIRIKKSKKIAFRAAKAFKEATGTLKKTKK
ncbi:MAG: HU family DNA-binding protein [Deltaproteobacteria bacterium]|nr:MAG: HU family DNA-binding protein [Deltaproteobacteria bacterium]